MTRDGGAKASTATADPDALWRHSAAALAALVADKEVSPVEVIEAHLTRIAEVNPAVNAIVELLDAEARTAAKAAETAVIKGDGLGPMHGVPVTIKVNIDVAGHPTDEGVPALAGAMPSADAPITARLRAAGAIPIGRTNMPDLGLRIHTDSSLHGLTRNPWDTRVTVGGSSGGEAAAIATGMSPAGIGNDIGGSLRNPAHCCGIASVKPTSGLVPWVRSTPPLDQPLSFQEMAVNGVMARHVEDLDLVLGCITGPHPDDPRAIPSRPVEPGRDAMSIALLPTPPGGTTDPGVADVVTAVGTALASAGHHVEEVVPPGYEDGIQMWGDWLLSDLRPMKDVLNGLMGQDAIRFLDLLYQYYPPLDAVALADLFVRRQQLARGWSRFLTEYDVIVAPVWTMPAFDVGLDIRDDAGAAAALELLRPVMHANLLGLPVVTVPGGTADGLPVGVQVMARWFAESVCQRVAADIERCVGLFTPIDPAA